MPRSDAQVIDRPLHAAKAARQPIATSAGREGARRPYATSATTSSANRKSPPGYQVVGAKPASCAAQITKRATARAPITNGRRLLRGRAAWAVSLHGTAFD